LAEAFEQAEPGKAALVPLAARKGVNLRTQMERIITKAGHKPWPPMFQNLRASCATDWVEKYPSHVVAKWLGHSPKVAAQHYLMSREHHFEDVVRGEGSEQPPPEFGSAPPAPCCADCSADAVHFADQQGPAPDRTESHETTEPAATTRVTAGSSEVTPFTRNGEMAGTGFEPATSRL
jgi:hypothetical protein